MIETNGVRLLLCSSDDEGLQTKYYYFVSVMICVMQDEKS
jgi:hypothetical protein